MYTIFMYTVNQQHLKGFVAGVVAGFVVAYVLDALIFDIFWTSVDSFIGGSQILDTALTMVTAALATFVGGMVAGRVAHNNSVLLGLAVGAALVLISYLIDIQGLIEFWHLLTPGFFVQLIAMDMVYIAAAAFGCYQSNQV